MGIVVGPEGASAHRSQSYVQLAETITDVTRQIEDLGWTSVSTDRPAWDLGWDDRRRVLQRIRLYRRRSPLAKQGAALLQHYTLGQGVTLKANNKAKVARLVDEFWEDPVNQAVFTSHQSQKDALDSLWTDGDLFIVLFPDEAEGTLHLGLLDPLLVEDIVTDPDNARVPLWYKARKPDSKFDFSTGTYMPGSGDDYVYYRDWQNDGDLSASGKKFAPRASRIAEGLIYHARINRRHKFGESELATAVDWLKSHKDFMEDRVSLNRAAAQIAWRKKRKGGPADIASEVARLQSSMVPNIARYESNPTPATASTIVENEGTTIDWMKTDTGGANALADERILRMMAGAAMGGIPNHYFGDEANANLATATAMELPLLKSYQDWQRHWGDIISDLVQFMLSTAHAAGRIGDRDDSSRYAERVTSPTKAIAANVGAAPASTPAPKTTSRITDPALAATMHEAIGDSMPAGGEQIAVRDPSLQISMMPKTEPDEVLFAANEENGKVDWFVDVDFPPIIERDATAILTALKTLYEFLPTGNVESQKLVVSQALIALGQNNIDEAMDRLFPTDAAGNPLPTDTPQDPAALLKMLADAQKRAAAVTATVSTPLQALLGPGPQAPAAPAPPKNVTPDAKMSEAAALADYRVRRVLRAVRSADEALAVLGDDVYDAAG